MKIIVEYVDDVVDEIDDVEYTEVQDNVYFIWTKDEARRLIPFVSIFKVTEIQETKPEGLEYGNNAK